MGASLPAAASAPDQAKTPTPTAQPLWGRSAPSPSYSQLLRDLRAGKISELELSPLRREVQVSYRNGQRTQVSVFSNGRLVRTMPTSMGMGGSETIGGRTISFWTQPGIYTVMDKANPVVMDSSTYGLPINSRLGYKQTINWATRISTDGIYLHQLEDTVWAQGNTNLSHGCLNLSADNARWFYDFSQPGDVVEVRDTGGAPLELWQNGDWSVPWPQWLAGSAPDPTAQQAPAPVAGDPPPLSLGKQGADGQPPR